MLTPLEIGKRLAVEADAARVPPPPRLRASTLEALREASLAADAKPRRRFLPAALAAVLLAAAATAAVLRFAPAPPGQAGPAGPGGADPPGAALAVLRIDATIRDRLRDLGTPWRDPLRTEALLVLSDARQARDFLLGATALPRSGTAVPSGTR